MSQLEGFDDVAAGVPYWVVPPTTIHSSSPMVVTWHMMDPPRTERAMAAALPLEKVDAWRVYLGLPMFGARTPAGGPEEAFALAAEDAVLKYFGPVLKQAISEFPDALTALRTEFALIDGSPLALVGGSAGGAVAIGVLTQTDVPVTAVSLINPLTTLEGVIGIAEKQFGMEYAWSDEARAVAKEFDAVAQASHIVERNPQSAMQFIVGELDDPGYAEPTEELYAALRSRYSAPEHVAMVTVTGMEHALANEPGLEPAPQTPSAAQADAAVTDWLNVHFRLVE